MFSTPPTPSLSSPSIQIYAFFPLSEYKQASKITIIQ